MDEETRTVNTREDPLGGVLKPRVSVGVLLVDQYRHVLLTLRNLPPEAGCWSIVGGKLDYLETLEDCAVREAFEEVGLRIAIDSLLCVTNHLLPAEGQHWVSPAYLGHILGGEARNCEPEKIRDVRWFPCNALPATLTMTARNAMDAYRRKVGGVAEDGRGKAGSMPGDY
jgi:8-oxo-dGTP diphosphatase